jgi:hypothetical protein
VGAEIICSLLVAAPKMLESPGHWVSLLERFLWRVVERERHVGPPAAGATASTIQLVFPRIPCWFLALRPEPFPAIKRPDEYGSVVALTSVT